MIFRFLLTYVHILLILDDFYIVVLLILLKVLNLPPLALSADIVSLWLTGSQFGARWLYTVNTYFPSLSISTFSQ